MEAILNFLIEDWHLIVIIILLWMVWSLFRYWQNSAEMHDKRVGEIMDLHARDRENLLKLIH